MTSGIQFEQGEIIIVPFPFSDLSGIKQRPVLILSKTISNRSKEDIITCGITSNIKETNYSVLISNHNLIRGQIPKQSRIKVDKLFSLEKIIVKKSIGRLNKETFEKVKKEFLNLI